MFKKFEFQLQHRCLPLALFAFSLLLKSFHGYSYLDIIAAAVLSGNRNFEGRVHPLTRANYLASPPLVVAYALAGTVCTHYLVYRCILWCFDDEISLP